MRRRRKRDVDKGESHRNTRSRKEAANVTLIVQKSSNPHVPNALKFMLAMVIK
jgi:hypothetical protein